MDDQSKRAVLGVWDLQKTTFQEVTDFLKHGREIEFSYNNKLYSITANKYWIFCCGDRMIERICPFEDKKTLVERVASFCIEGVPVPVIFDNDEYDEGSVCIL